MPPFLPELPQIGAQALFCLWSSCLNDVSCSPQLQVEKLRSTGHRGLLGLAQSCPPLPGGLAALSCAVLQQRTQVSSVQHEFDLSSFLTTCKTQGLSLF